ncbi:MAG: SRPBCC domain-containing protein [Pleurocapsa minor HA4230-MV1]|nr:SRPBCC domain-containing protein [Pleurocapsa minor HA4230-MV1]
MKEQVKLNIFYPHPPEKVWQALTDCRILNAWMMNNNFEPCLGHKFKFESNSLPGIITIIHCEVVELNKPKRLAYTWQDEMTSEPSLRDKLTELLNYRNSKEEWDYRLQQKLPQVLKKNY